MYMSYNKKIKTGIPVVFLLIALVAGCTYNKEELLYPGSTGTVDCTTVSSSFKDDVKTIIDIKCATAGCHDATASGGFIFQNYTQINSAKDRIKAQAVVLKTMPQSGPLPTSEINILKCWIESGAPNN